MVTDIFKKKNRYFVLFILFLVFLVAVAFVWYQGKGRININEGFQPTPNAIALLKYSSLTLDLTNEKTSGSYDRASNSPGWSVNWSPPPDTLPKAMIDSINNTYRQWQLMSRFDEEPDTFIRLDGFTHTPYTLDLKTFDPTKVCVKEYKIDPGAAVKQSPSGFYKVFTSTLGGEALAVRRKQCGIEITPQYLSTLPWRFQQKYLDYILKEQENLILWKSRSADLNGRTCADKRDGAAFPKEMRDAYEAKKKQERDAAKKQVKEEIKKAAEQSLVDIAKETGKTVNQIRNDPVLRNTLRNAPSVQKLRATPYAVFSSVMNVLGFDITKKVLEGILNVFRGGDPFAGLECPIGYEESSEISLDPTIKAMSDIFPNPISDVTNLAATRGICTKYIPGKPGEEPKVETREKICDTTYVLPPKRLVPLATPPAKCEMDRDINKKLQIASDWLTSTSIKDKTTNYIYVIERFDYVANPNEYFVEAAFQVRGYTKNTVPKVLYDTKSKLPSARTQGTIESFPQKAKMRFYFNKKDCEYTILGYGSEAKSDRLIFFQEWDESGTTDYVPPINPLFTIYEYAVKKNIQNPIDYAIQNEKNADILKTIVAERDASRTKIQEEQTELEGLLQSLNPTKDEFLKDSLESQPLEDLRERDTLIKKLNDPLYTQRYWDIKTLRERLKEIEDKKNLVEELNPTKDPNYTTFYMTLSMDDLRWRQRTKEKRDEYLRILNPLKDTTLEFQLNQLDTNELERQAGEKKEKDKLIREMNPKNDIALTSSLSSLSLVDLRTKYDDFMKRKTLLQYFNPNNDANLNASYLDKFTTPQLQERQTLISTMLTSVESQRFLFPNYSETVGSLNALDIDTLKKKYNEVMDIINAWKQRDIDRQKRYEEQVKQYKENKVIPVGWTRQQWWENLPAGHDCRQGVKAFRKNCPSEYPF